MDPTDLPAGTMVGDYRVEGRIGRGGMGTVYRAVHPVIGRRVAIKVLNRSFADRSEAVARFVSEARTIHRVKHSGVLDVLTFGMMPGGDCYYVMELLEGENVRSVLMREGRLAPRRAIEIIDAVAAISNAAHEAGIVHRDLRPESVFLSRDPRSKSAFEVKLLDFGVAKLTGEGDEPVDPREDIRALARVAFEMLTGRPPIQPDEIERSPRPSEVARELAPFDAPITTAMSKSGSEGPKSALDLARELRQVVLDLERKQRSLRMRWRIGIAASMIAAAIAVAAFAEDPPPALRVEPSGARIEAPPIAPPQLVIEEAPDPPPKMERPAPKKKAAKPPAERIVPDMPVRF